MYKNMFKFRRRSLPGELEEDHRRTTTNTNPNTNQPSFLFCPGNKSHVQSPSRSCESRSKPVGFASSARRSVSLDLGKEMTNGGKIKGTSFGEKLRKKIGFGKNKNKDIERSFDDADDSSSSSSSSSSSVEETNPPEDEKDLLSPLSPGEIPLSPQGISKQNLTKDLELFEAEVVREMERCADWKCFNNPSSKRKRRRGKSRSDSDFEKELVLLMSPTATPTPPPPEEGDEEDGQLRENEDGNDSSPSSSSASTPTNEEQLPLVTVEEYQGSSAEGEKKRPSFLESISHKSTPGNSPMLSPRSAHFLKKDVYLNLMDLPPPSPPTMQMPVHLPSNRVTGEAQAQVEGLTKAYEGLKRNLRDLEKEYETLFGYRPSHSDKMGNKEMKRILMKIGKVSAEISALRDDPTKIPKTFKVKNKFLSVSNRKEARSSTNNKDVLSGPGLTTTVQGIMDTLHRQREQQGRPHAPEKMSLQELQDEKNALQKQLIVLERKHGRPNKNEEREAVKDLYERYRLVKRRILLQGKEGVDSLMPIIEHVALDYINEEQRKPFEEEEEEDEDAFEEPEEKMEQDGDNELFHEMSLDQLESRLFTLRQQKRHLRSLLRRFETDFEQAMGRLPTKEEKRSANADNSLTPQVKSGSPSSSSVHGQGDYAKYKRIRAKVKLIEVLITKERKRSSV